MQGRALGGVIAAAVLLLASVAGAQAYNPTRGVLYQLGNEPCLKGRNNCAVYPNGSAAERTPGGVVREGHGRPGDGRR
jgi:hypothetical protein